MPNPVSTLLIAGLTGAGKTLALQQLEQLGYVGLEAIPPALIPDLVAQLRPHHPRLVLGLDLRVAPFRQDLLDQAAWLEQAEISLLFLEASTEILIRRLGAHRRPHWATIETGGLKEAIEQERRELRPVRDLAAHILDTSALDGLQLRQQLAAWVSASIHPLQVTLISFGFKYGLPLDANLVFDVRFLPNPFFIPSLRMLTGQDGELQDHLFQDPLTQSTFAEILGLLKQFLPRYQQERRPLVTVAIGCTGGQHRSVALVERLIVSLTELMVGSAVTVQAIHRNLQDSQRELQARFGPGRDHA